MSAVAQHAKEMELEELTLEDVLNSVENCEIEATESEAEELNPSVQTKVQTVVFIIVWLNQLFSWFGMPVLDVDPNLLYTVFSGIATFAVSVWNYWFNNSWTPAAILGDKVKDEVKEQLAEGDE